MNSERYRRLLPSDLLLLILIFATPLMKPAVSGKIIAADLIFVVLAVTVSIEVLAGLRRLGWITGYGPLLVYLAGLGCSLMATSEPEASLFKFSTEFYLVGLAAVCSLLVDDEEKLRRAIFAWLAATALLCMIAVLSLMAFATGWAGWLLDYSSFGFGSLPPGDYTRLALTFFNANMACNYLTIGVALAFVSRRLGYIARLPFTLVLIGITIASLSTISPGLGGVALVASLCVWRARRQRSPRLASAMLGLGILVAGLFIVALALTPFAHSTAPFVIHLPGRLTLYPAPRLMTWIAALRQFATHPLVGIGIGIDPVHVGYANPSGYEVLTDAHNLFLSIAAQCGIAGLIGVGAIIYFVIVRTRPPSAGGRGQAARFLLGATFLDVFAYQGLGGSFEDTRHVWLLLGLVIAANRIDFTPAGGNSHRADLPSSG
jgi:O-antigen ligase